MGNGGTAPLILTSPLDGGNQIRAPTGLAPTKDSKTFTEYEAGWVPGWVWPL